MASFGELQNQAYGYLFPQGPFFLARGRRRGPGLGSAAGLVGASARRRLRRHQICRPGSRHGRRPWGACRSGLRTLAEAAGRGGRAQRRGVAERRAAMGGAAARAGSCGPAEPPPGRLWCGVAVLCMSGVNGAGVIAVLPVLALLALTRLRIRKDVGWPSGGWSAWRQPVPGGWCRSSSSGRYSPPFLDFIETSSATTNSTGWSNSVRGADHWLELLQPRRPGLVARRPPDRDDASAHHVQQAWLPPSV